jgi:hypothetical protein
MRPELQRLALIALPVALLVAAGIVVGVRALRRWRARRSLQQRIGAVASEVLRDVILPDGGDGWFHVDYVLLTATGILVIDLRDVPGLIFGGEQMDEWAVMFRNRRSTFPNPLGPLYDRVAAVRLLAGEGVPVEGRVVFTDRAEFPKGHPRLVTPLAQLAEALPAPAEEEDGVAAAPLAPAWERVKTAATPSRLAARR